MERPTVSSLREEVANPKPASLPEKMGIVALEIPFAMGGFKDRIWSYRKPIAYASGSILVAGGLLASIIALGRALPQGIRLDQRPQPTATLTLSNRSSLPGLPFQTDAIQR